MLKTFSELIFLLGVIISLARVACSSWSICIKSAITEGIYFGDAYIRVFSIINTYIKDIDTLVAYVKGAFVRDTYAKSTSAGATSATKHLKMYLNFGNEAISYKIGDPKENGLIVVTLVVNIILAKI